MSWETWHGLADGPNPQWPVEGQLEAASREWLVTTGNGAYSMSTIALMHTRRQHGLLVAALEPPRRSFVVLSHDETTIEVDGKSYGLSTHRFPDVAPTPGYRYLQHFAQDPLPRWLFSVPGGNLERTLAPVPGQNAIVLRFLWNGAERAKLSLRPLLPFRPARELMKEHGAMVQRVSLRTGEVSIQPLHHIPPVRFRHNGAVFVGSPDWWRRFEYEHERALGLDSLEDLWTPGVFDLYLKPGRPAYLAIGLGDLPDGEPAALFEQGLQHERSLCPAAPREPLVQSLMVAADRYCSVLAPDATIVAGFPDFGHITRDALVALPGLLLARGREDDAVRVLSRILSQRLGGLLPDLLDGREARPQLDACLWFFDTANCFVNVLGTEAPFVRTTLFPAVRDLVQAIWDGEVAGTAFSHDGLLTVTSEGTTQLTWMDSALEGIPITPRRGAPVEYQAFWSLGLRLLARLALAYGEEELGDRAARQGEQLSWAFRDRFWCHEQAYPFDVLGLSRDFSESRADAGVRPNAVIALAVAPELFDDWQVDAILDRAQAELVTGRGLRTLSPNDERYHGYHDGFYESRQAAYHQGTSWPFLLGFYVSAMVRRDPEDARLRRELRELLEDACTDPQVLGQVGQLADGDAPHSPGGCPAVAWSVAKLLQAAVMDLGL